jgi:translation initiation factor IF-1
MSNHGSTHVKKSALIKGKKSGKKSIVKYGLPTANVEEGEQYARIISCLGDLRFKIELSNKTQVMARAGNTFKKSKRNPLGEPIVVGNLVKVDYYLGIYNINHVYTADNEEELDKIGELNIASIATIENEINFKENSSEEGPNENWLDDI